MMMQIWTYFVKLLSPIIVFTHSFLLLNLVTTTYDPKDVIYTSTNCQDVTLKSVKSH